MKIKLLSLKGMLLLLICNINYTYAQIPDSCTFVEKDSIITIEMESTNLNGGFWVKQTDLPDYLGSGFIQYIGGDAIGVPGISQLSYTFRVKEAGRHSFKMRGYRDGYHDNDVWVRFPQGGVMTKIGSDSTGTMGSNWFKAVIGARDQWYGFVKTQHLGTAWGETFHDIYVDFPAPGVYTVEFSGRATGFRIDRFMLYYQRSSFHGMATTNAESARENCSPYNMAGKPYVENPMADQTVDGGTPWTYTFPSNTFGGSSLGYTSFLGSMSPLPAWMSFNAATRTFTGNPTYAEGGQYTILVKAENNGAHAVDAFILTVNGNNPPVMSSALKDTVANIGQTFMYDMNPNFSDEDGHTLTYTAVSHEGPLPSWLSLNGSSFIGNPTTSDLGNDTIYVTVSDGNGGSLTETFIITVKSVSIQGTNGQVSRINGSIYPNPTDNIVNLRMDEEGNGTLTLSDNLGRIFYYQEDMDLGKEISVDLSSLNLQPGLYVFRIKSEEKGSEYNGLVIKK
jgi:hypothetical protein